MTKQFTASTATTSHSAARRKCVLLGAIVGLLSIAAIDPAVQSASAASASQDADWLTVVNQFRVGSNLAPVAVDPAASAGAANHSCYMLFNGITHDETPGLQGYTTDGDASGNSSNVAVSSVLNSSSRSFVELWMTGPFHAIGILRPNLQTAAFGRCDNSATPTWHSAGTLDVLHGLAGPAGISQPILFPGNGSTTTLTHFITESPNPLDFCGWTGTAGLPIIAMMPEAITTQPSATVNSSAGPLDVCVLSALNTTGHAKDILAGNNAIVVIPRSSLALDTYSVAVNTPARSINWKFTVGTTSSAGPLASNPVTATTPIGAPLALQAIAPVRVVDTRSNLGTTQLAGGTLRRIQVSGVAGIPAGAQAISANITITNPSAAGYLTVWNCSNQPVVSTLNFAAGETVPNGAMVALDTSGALCAYSSATADLLIDVNGYYATSGGQFAPITPTRLMDSRTTNRLAGGSVTTLKVTGTAGVPVGATLVVLNVTSVFPDAAGFVTVYPCDAQRPTVSSLNPQRGSIKPNLVVTPVAADGTICLFTLTAVDLIVDITGYVSPTATQRFTPSTPFRLIDTRQIGWTELQAGTDGGPILQGQTVTINVAGTRGIAADAKTVSVNFTAAGGASTGFITAYPCGTRPVASVLNFEPTTAIANAAQLPLSADGTLCVFASTTVHLIVDVNGWWS